MNLFIARQQHKFDPGTPWSLELTVKRQTGPLDSEFAVFPLEYQLPDQYYTRAEPVLTEEEWLEEQPLWVQVWYQKEFQLMVLGAGILVLLFILFFQDWLVQKPKMMRWIRHGFLVYTLFFIGWYALGQLSIVNVLTFVNSLISGFTWETFLIDPICSSSGLWLPASCCSGAGGLLRLAVPVRCPAGADQRNCPQAEGAPVHRAVCLA